MQSRHFDEMYSRIDLEKAMSNFEAEQFAAKVKEETVNLPAGARTPTVTEVLTIHQYMVNYRKQSPKASKREVRNSAKKKFNIQILKNT